MNTLFKRFVAQLPDSMREITYRVHVLEQDVSYVAKMTQTPEKAVEMLATAGWNLAMERMFVHKQMENEEHPCSALESIEQPTSPSNEL